jgi:hypothetical protein
MKYVLILILVMPLTLLHADCTQCDEYDNCSGGASCDGGCCIGA